MQLFLNRVKKIWDILEHFKVLVRDWFVVRAHGAHAKAWLAALSFTEASFFPFPPDALLLPILFVDASRWVYYAFITTLFSVLGAIFAYIIGAFLFDMVGNIIISTYGLEEEMQYIATLFEDNAFWTIFAAAFTPVPYKAFTLSAGFFSVNFFIFVTASVMGRGARFFALGYIARRYGKTLGSLIFKYINVASIALVITGILVVLFVKIF